MIKNEKNALIKDRYNRLKESQKNVKCGGVVRKLTRAIRKMESDK